MAASVDSLSIQITASTKSAKDKIDALVTSLGRLSTAIDALDTSKLESLSASAVSLSQGLSGLKGSSVSQVTKMAKALKDMALNEQAFESVIDTAVQGFSQMGANATEAAQGESLMAEGLEKLNAQPLEDISNAMSKVSETVGATTSTMSGFKSLLASMKIIVPTDSLDAVNKKISALTEKAQELQERLDYKTKTNAEYVDSAEMEKDQKKIQGLISEIDRLMLKKQELESHGGFRLNFEGFSNVAKSISKANDKLKSFASHLFRAKSASRDTAKATDNFSLSANKLAKELLRVSKMLKLMVTRMALRAVIKEVGNGFKSLALHSAEFDNAMSGLINASKQLGYSFAGMVSPLINALAPALVYIINLAIKAVNVFNQLFSILSGKGTWNKAKSFTGKWSDEIKNANKQAKELKKTVLGFDELNQLQDNKNSGADTSGNIEDMFETVNTEKKWQDFIDKLVNPLKKAWANVGDEVMAAWKRAFENIKKLGSDIARDFWKVWQQPETQKIFEDILKIVRDIGDFVANITEQLDKAWNKNQVGLRILEKIRDLIGIIVAGVQRITESWANWAATIDFYPLLKAVNSFLESLKQPAEAIMGIFEDLNKDFIQPLAKWLIETGIPELIGVFSDFNNKVQWDVIRERLDRVWKALEPFAETVGQGLIIFIQDISDALADLLNSDKWDKFIDGFVRWTNDVKPEDIAAGLKLIIESFVGLKIIGALIPIISSAVSAFSGLSVSLIPTVPIVASLTVAVYSLTQSFGGLAGTSERLEDGLSKISDVFKKVSENLKVSDSINELKKSIKGLLTELGSMRDYWNVILKVLGTVVTLIGGNLISIFNTLTKTLSGVISAIEGTVTILKAFGEIVVGIFVGNGDKIKQGWKDIWDGVYKIFTSSISALKAIADGLVDIIVQPFKTIKYMLIGDPIVIDMWDGIKRIFESSIKAVVGFVNNLKTDMVNTFTNIKNSIINIFSDIQKEFTRFFSKDKWTFGGVAEGLKKTFEDAKNGIKNIWNSIADKLNGDYEIGEGHMHINLPKFYATGGFPEDGWFRASHGEMLGKFDNGQSVVANNQQITEGIARAVYSAMMSANSGNGGNVPIYTTIQIGEEEVARAVTRGQRKIDRRYSPTTT